MIFTCYIHPRQIDRNQAKKKHFADIIIEPINS
jgi:hypothetical protein